MTYNTIISFSQKPVKIIELTDPSCNYCITPTKISQIMGNISKKETITIGINSKEGYELAKKYQISFFPAYIFSKELEKQKIFENINESLVQQEDKTYLALYSKVGVSKTLLVPTIADDYILGNSSAPLTLFMFGDFECVLCGKFAREVLPKLKTEYIDTNKINFVFKDSPDLFRFTTAGVGERLVFEAVTTNCAGEQGKYWQA